MTPHKNAPSACSNMGQGHHTISTRKNSSRGFSLLEVTIALSISGILFNAIWQLTSVAGVQREVAGISSQAVTVSSAANSYINGQRSALLALPDLAALGDVARIKITDTDTGDTATSVQGAGYLPQGFININSYGQSYALFVRREDAGVMGSADAGDRLVGLLITTNGEAITDIVGAKIAANMGAAGGFLYADSNPTAPSAATTARGSAGGWEVDLNSAGWSDIGSAAKAGRLAMLVNLLAASSGGGSGSGGATDIDGLEDGKTDYSNNNMYMGEAAGQGVTTGNNNLAIGKNALIDTTSQNYNLAIGHSAGTRAMGSESIIIGHEAGSGSGGSVRSRSVAIGNQAMRYGQAESSVALGYSAMIGYNGGQSVGIGWGALYNGNGNHNVGIGGTVGSADPIGAALTSGSQNVMIGASAMRNLSTGNNNVALGHLAGVSASTGSNNINIGSLTDVAVATADNQLNIGNTIYGNLATDQINIGSPTIVAGVALDVGTNTSASRFSVGTVAQRPTCNASLEGAQRYNVQTQTQELCVGNTWMQPSPAWVPANGTPPIPNPMSGYFVMTNATWDGNLGGFAGAAAKCYSDLTANDWNNKANAIATGSLIPANVRAFLCTGNAAGPCTALLPMTTYYFARSGFPLVGGAQFTTDADGYGPINNYSWSASNYFSSGGFYWTGMRGYNTYPVDNIFLSSQWNHYENNGYNAYNQCAGWTSNSASLYGDIGDPGQTNHRRWRAKMFPACNTQQRLICIVDP